MTNGNAESDLEVDEQFSDTNYLADEIKLFRRTLLKGVGVCTFAGYSGITNEVVAQSDTNENDWLQFQRDTTNSAYNPGANSINNGEQKWTFSVNSPGISPPVVSNGIVYFGVENGVHAIDLSSESQVWQTSIDGQVRTSPAVHDNKLFVNTSIYIGPSKLLVFNKQTGKEEWTFEYDTNI